MLSSACELVNHCSGDIKRDLCWLFQGSRGRDGLTSLEQASKAKVCKQRKKKNPNVRICFLLFDLFKPDIGKSPCTEPYCRHLLGRSMKCSSFFPVLHFQEAYSQRKIIKYIYLYFEVIPKTL